MWIDAQLTLAELCLISCFEGSNLGTLNAVLGEDNISGGWIFGIEFQDLSPSFCSEQVGVRSVRKNNLLTLSQSLVVREDGIGEGCLD